MESLILLIVFGLGLAYFATQNTGSVHMLFGTFLVSGIPLYVIVIGSVLLGVFISWLISMLNTFSVLFTLRGKDAALRKAEKEVKHLEERNHALEMEIARINGHHPDREEVAEETRIKHPSFFEQLSQNFGLSPK